jgi:hypothetical protein
VLAEGDLRDDAVQPPAFRDALQLVLAGVLESETGARD